MRFIIRCTDYEADTIYWTYQDFINSQDSIDVSNCPDPPDVRWRLFLNIHFQNHLVTVIILTEYYLIRTHIITACDITPNGINQLKLVEPNHFV